MTAKTLFQKLAEAQKATKPVPKRGFNKFSNYAYVKDEDLMQEAKRCLHVGGLVSYSSTDLIEIDNSSDQKRAVILQTVHVVDPDSGESFSISMPGQAFDKNGDKALYKASTGANKYAYMRILCLSTGDDPEDDSAEKTAKPKPPAKQAPQAMHPTPQRELALAGINALVMELKEKHGIEFDFWPARYSVSTSQMTNEQLEIVKTDMKYIIENFNGIQFIQPFGGF